LKPANSMFHWDCWSGGLGAGSWTAGPPVKAIFGIPGPSGGRLCAKTGMGIAEAKKSSKHSWKLLPLLLGFII
jgi:hypothetical protein